MKGFPVGVGKVGNRLRTGRPETENRKRSVSIDQEYCGKTLKQSVSGNLYLKWEKESGRSISVNKRIKY